MVSSAELVKVRSLQQYAEMPKQKHAGGFEKNTL